MFVSPTCMYRTTCLVSRWPEPGQETGDYRIGPSTTIFKKTMRATHALRGSEAHAGQRQARQRPAGQSHRCAVRIQAVVSAPEAATRERGLELGWGRLGELSDVYMQGQAIGIGSFGKVRAWVRGGGDAEGCRAQQN